MSEEEFHDNLGEIFLRISNEYPEGISMEQFLDILTFGQEDDEQLELDLDGDISI